jgi:hypothetical protein
MQPLSRITAATIDVLAVLDAPEKPVWGLLVIKQSGRPAGTVYPILERLETACWVTSSWEADDARSGPRRRYYELTDEGSAAAKAALDMFAAARRARASLVPARVVTA